MFGMSALRVNGQRVGGIGIFGVMIWMLFLRFIVPVLGVFYGTALMADEVEDKTITYLFTRPIPRGAVLVGKYLAYVVCTLLVVLPSVMLVYFLLVPFRGDPGDVWAACSTDLGLLGLGWRSTARCSRSSAPIFKRPLVIGLVFAFGWEQVVLALPGYMKRFTMAYYMQALVPHAMPSEGVISHAAGSVPRYAAGVRVAAWLAAYVGVIFLYLAARTVERKEYVLEQ